LRKVCLKRVSDVIILRCGLLRYGTGSVSYLGVDQIAYLIDAQVAYAPRTVPLTLREHPALKS